MKRKKVNAYPQKNKNLRGSSRVSANHEASMGLMLNAMRETSQINMAIIKRYCYALDERMVG